MINAVPCICGSLASGARYGEMSSDNGRPSGRGTATTPPGLVERPMLVHAASHRRPFLAAR